jgi:hypothetical protein
LMLFVVVCFPRLPKALQPGRRHVSRAEAGPIPSPSPLHRRETKLAYYT